ncbi:MAG: PINc/VapC family ATPase [DPANN group archaeon]|nr:PINc/VapC family ATPase [DPANN group archaeon]
MKYVPDTSAIIEGKVMEMIRDGKLKGTLIIPEFVVSELENQANHGKEIGFTGLDELKAIRDIAKEKKITITQIGRKPTAEEIKMAGSGRIDALIRDIAREEKATLLTGDIVQAKTAEAEGVDVLYFEKEMITSFALEDYFDKDTMSVHLKDGATPKAKKGKPGAFELVTLSKELITKATLESIAHEIMELNRVSDESFTEITRKNVSVIQLKEYRIAITRPPFSEKMEITAIRPITKISLPKYNLSEKLMSRITKDAEGIIIAGPPGHGKSTLCQALAEYYNDQKKIVKTMENPRDLQVGSDITQYGLLEGCMEKTAEILLLVRPDITIYDEIRQTKDFRIYSDMRLAGVGMVGVVHATRAIDVMHRFIGRIELGMIPQILDTIIFVKGGKIESVSSLALKVKVPHGMVEKDLARPVIDVYDFETGDVTHEIYTYGDETVVMPVENIDIEESPLNRLAEDKIRKVLKKFTRNPDLKITSPKNILVRVPKEDISALIGKKGATISSLEEKLGMHISVEPIVETLKESAPYNISESGGYINICFEMSYIGMIADIYKADDFLFSATIGKKAQIKVKKRSDIGKKVMQGAVMKDLKVLVE